MKSLNEFYKITSDLTGKFVEGIRGVYYVTGVSYSDTFTVNMIDKSGSPHTFHGTHADFSGTYKLSNKSFPLPKTHKEADEKNMKSVQYLKGLLKNISNRSAKKMVSTWIKRGGNKKMVQLSDKEAEMLVLINKGGPYPKDFSTKN